MKTTPTIGAIVKVTNDPDATQYKVTQTNGPRVAVVPHLEHCPLGFKHAEQWIDRSIISPI